MRLLNNEVGLGLVFLVLNQEAKRVKGLKRINLIEELLSDVSSQIDLPR